MSMIKFVFIIFLSSTLMSGCSPVPQATNSETKAPQFSEEIQAVLNQERNLLHREMDNPVYLEVLNTANTDKKNQSMTTILQLDRQWTQNSPKEVLSKTLLNAACSNQLRVFRSEHPEFAEVFITDGQGLNVCMTNKTSDYYQADEDWWINTDNSNDPYGSYGPIEYDDSSSTESVALFLPILDPTTGNKIGILKAVLKLSTLAEGL